MLRATRLRNVKGILLAGGSGTRLHPLSVATSKQLLPVYDKPAIYYPLSTLILAGIKDVMIIANPGDISSFKKLLGSGRQWGIDLTYQIQEKPRGIAEAFIIGEEFIGSDSVCLVLGDNLFHGTDLETDLQNLDNLNGGRIFAIRVKDPERFGVVDINDQGQIVSIVEKPLIPASNFAIPGLYFFDNSVCSKAKSLKFSARNELEITDIHKIFLDEQKLTVKILSRGTSWFDLGTPDSLLDASSFVRVVQNRQSILIGSPDEASYRKGFISKSELCENYSLQRESSYGQALKTLIDEIA